MKCISKPVMNQLFSILDTFFFFKETRFTVLILNRQHVFHLESETLWCSGYKKNFQTWWALAPTDTLSCVIELVTSQNVCAYFFI